MGSMAAACWVSAWMARRRCQWAWVVEARLSWRREAETWMVSMMDAVEMRGLVHRRGGGDDRNDFDGVAGGDGISGGEFEGENLIDVEVLRGEDAVGAFEREGSLSIERVRDMRLGLPGD
jgi:hypothetical protein